MIAFPELLLEPAKQAGIKIPPEADWDRLYTIPGDEYPHLVVFINLQIGRSMPTPDAHWNNAKVIAAIPEDRIRLVTERDLEQLGFV